MDDRDRARWVTALTTSGWLVLFAYVAMVVAQLRRATAIRRSAFPDGVWGQRLETVAFVVDPSNSVLLLATAIAATAATLLAGELIDRRHVWLAQLTWVAPGLAYVMIAIAGMRVLALLLGGPDAVADFGAIVRQLAGILVCAATVRLCIEAERR